LATQGGVFNPQTQQRVKWPDEPVVALAFLDQLQRSGDVTDTFSAKVTTALAESDTGALKQLARELDDASAEGVAERRKAGLAAALSGIAASLD
jgi:phage FluMu protein gp41